MYCVVVVVEVSTEASGTDGGLLPRLSWAEPGLLLWTTVAVLWRCKLTILAVSRVIVAVVVVLRIYT